MEAITGFVICRIDVTTRRADPRHTGKLIRVVTVDHFGHRRYVAARTERSPGSRNHDDTDISFTAGSLEGFRQVAPHVSGERIQLFRAIEPDRGDARVFSDFDVFVHERFEFRVSSSGFRVRSTGVWFEPETRNSELETRNLLTIYP
jgi:hypothetical protein